MYTSTRNSKISIPSAYAIKQGISEEGGLFVPESFPEINISDIKDLDYMGRASHILGKLLSDFTAEEINECVSLAYGGKFCDGVAPLKKLDDSRYVLELWHGPTCAFKDMALQILPHLITKSIAKTGEKDKVLILVATSGDTGKAALEGFKDVCGTDIFVFYPQDGVSSIQKLQMTTQEGSNVFTCGIDGNFDDAQSGVKEIFTDDEAKEYLSSKGYKLSSANSINLGRLVPQIVYYFSAYCDMCKMGEINVGDEINITVPTGNFGNILAAYYAKKMGLPVKKLICASNINNVLTDFINKGEYSLERKFYTTVSPSMDILISSNLERLLYDFLGDDEKLKTLMNGLKENKKYKVDDDVLNSIKEIFYGDFSDENETKECIANTFENYNYLIDTHTAVAVNVYNKYADKTGDNTKTVIASTASPYKFNEAVLSALGENISGDEDKFDLIDKLHKISGLPVPESLSELKNKEVRFKESIDKTEMKNKVFSFIDKK